ncbi:MAG: DNA polymerase IV [Coriobacteriia bacterium]|nr:DNA polymerase IV [Coriobacteriia bacterium]
MTKDAPHPPKRIPEKTAAAKEALEGDPHPYEARPWLGRAVLHVDLDAFFASVEQLDHPEWRGRPVIVGGEPGRRGVVSTASYEARAYGVHSAMPSTRAAQLCPDAVWVGGNYTRYAEISAAVFEIFDSESPFMQPLSIDEAFLEVTPTDYSTEHPIAIARRIKARIADLGITGSIGVATSRTVAKIASDFEKPDGLTVVCQGEEAGFLAPLPVRSMSGIGPKTAKRLAALGIKTLGDLAAIDPETASQVLGSQGIPLVERARGIDARRVHSNDPAKQVSNERTFVTDVRDSEELDAVIDMLSAKVGARLRRKGLSGHTVSVKLRFSDFTTKTVQKSLPGSTDDELVFAPVARKLTRSIWTPGVGVRLLGIGISGFNERAEQLSLTADGDNASGLGAGHFGHDSRAGTARRANRGELVRGVDAVRARFGNDSLRFGREFVHGDRMRKATETAEEADGEGA